MSNNRELICRSISFPPLPLSLSAIESRYKRGENYCSIISLDCALLGITCFIKRHSKRTSLPSPVPRPLLLLLLLPNRSALRCELSSCCYHTMSRGRARLGCVFWPRATQYANINRGEGAGSRQEAGEMHLNAT